MNPQSTQFTRRTHTDGRTDSICMSCFATVRAARNESLEDAEKMHLGECTRAQHGMEY